MHPPAARLFGLYDLSWSTAIIAGAVALANAAPLYLRMVVTSDHQQSIDGVRP